jgi:inorganic triphosphatase YgiF
MPQEIEIRLAARPDDLRRLSRRGHLNGFATARLRARKLYSVYYDTPDLRFAKAGLALRVRRTPEGFVQTVKDSGDGALANARAEFETKLRRAEPDLAAVPDETTRALLIGIAGGENLQPVLETDIKRATRALKTQSGDEIELAFDQGEIRPLKSGHAAVPVSELEIELKHGSALSLYEAARDLSLRAGLMVAIESKAERGLRALQGRPICASKAGRVEMAPDCTAEDAFRITLLHCLQHIARNVPAVAQMRDPEGVHQIRVGLRRLRAALSGFGDAFRVPPIENLRARAKTLADVFGETRDLDVFSTELLKPVEDASKRPGLADLRLRLEELHRQSWDNTVNLVHSDDLTGFLIDFGAAVEARVWREAARPAAIREPERPAREIACEALDKLLKKACKRARHLSRLGISERHRLRIALKKLRYSAEFFAPLFPADPVASFLRRLSKLQDLFGALNDAATAEAILRRLTAQADADAGTALREAAAFVDGWHQSRVDPMWTKAKTRWKRFAKAEPFWRA